MTKSKYAEFSIKVLITIGIALGAIGLPIALYYIFPHFVPFFIAYLIALILEPLNHLLIKRVKLSRFIAVNITYFLFVGLFSFLAYFSITRITTQMVDLIKFIQKNLPNILNWVLELNTQIQDFIRLLPVEIGAQVNKSITSSINKLASLDLLTNIGTQTYNISTAIPNILILIIIVFVSIYLFSLYLHSLNEKFYSLFKKESQDKVKLVLKDMRLATIGFMQAQIILSTITYLISLVTLAILGVNYYYAIAFLVVLVDILPILGTGSFLMPWAAFSLTQGNTFLALGLVALFIIQLVVRRAIEPKILGERIGLGPLATLISIWIGFKVMGIIGVFLGPLLLILYKTFVNAGIIKNKIKL